MRRDRRLSVRRAFQVDVRPRERAQFLGTHADQQRKHDIGVQAAVFGGAEHGEGLVEVE